MVVSAAHPLRTEAWRLLHLTIDSIRREMRKERQRAKLFESGQLVIGRHSYGVPEIVVFPGEPQRAVIGSFCSIADDVRIFVGGNHRTDWISTFPFRIVFGLPGQHVDGCPTSKGDVIVGHDVWIGAGARVLSGVHIGNGAVIGASAVVASDVRPYAIVVGNPAQEIRKRFSDDHIAMLEDIAWWDWSLERIIDNVDFLCSPDIASFCAAQPDVRSLP